MFSNVIELSVIIGKSNMKKLNLPLKTFHLLNKFTQYFLVKKIISKLNVQLCRDRCNVSYILLVGIKYIITGNNISTVKSIIVHADCDIFCSRTIVNHILHILFV